MTVPDRAGESTAAIVPLPEREGCLRRQSGRGGSPASHTAARVTTWRPIDDGLRRTFLDTVAQGLAEEVTVAECHTRPSGDWCAVFLERQGVPLRRFLVWRLDIDSAVRGVGFALDVLRTMLAVRIGARAPGPEPDPS